VGAGRGGGVTNIAQALSGLDLIATHTHRVDFREAANLAKETLRILADSPKRKYRRASVKPATPQGLAVQIASAAAEEPVQVYRKRGGAVCMGRIGERIPKEAEFIGTYDAGANWRDILADLKA
jgi:hypothetical protein